MAVPNWLTYSNQNATRSQPLNPDLVRALSFLPDLGVTLDVYSGGQPAAGQGPRVGSTRHDHGNAADVRFLRDGRMLDWNNPSDLPLLQDIVSRARASGITGIGAGDDYMGAGRFHVGFGPEAVWGAGGKSANAPDWLKTAYNNAGTGVDPSIVDRVNSNITSGVVSRLPSTAAPGTIMEGDDGRNYQFVETTGMAGATGSNGWIPTSMAAGGGISGLLLQAESPRRTPRDYGLSIPQNPSNAWEGLQSASGNIATALLNFYGRG